MSALLDNGIDVTALHNHFLCGRAAHVLHARQAPGSPATSRAVKPAIVFSGKGATGRRRRAAPALRAVDDDRYRGSSRRFVCTPGDQSAPSTDSRSGANDLKLPELGAPMLTRGWAQYVGSVFVGTNGTRRPRAMGDAGTVRFTGSRRFADGLDVVLIHHH